ncbi:2-oxo-4-hydroxy-4-carboxy-5-ureidoimidazoline decarboxylase [Microlunatus lacustris]
MTTPRVELTEAELREGLSACLTVPRWVDDVVARAPFSSLLELMDAAAAAATPLSAEEVQQALAAQPRVAEKARGQQAAVSPEEEAVTTAIAEGNRAYEQRFGRVFLIRSAGRDASTILRELQRRLTLDDATEAATAASELRDIALLRIPQLFGHLDHHSGFADAEAAE